MNKEDIIKSLEEHIKTNPKLIYYNQCKQKIKEMPEKIAKIPNQAEYLESMRIHICYNMNKYKVILYNKIKKNCAYIRYSVTEDIYNKLIYQLVAIKETNSILGLAEVKSIPIINLRKKNDKVVFFILIVPNEEFNKMIFKEKYFEMDNLYESMGYVFGVDVMKLLKYQRLDRIVEFIKTSGESHDNLKLLDNYLKMLQKYDWKLRDKFMIHSGTIYEALGTTYTRDIDVLILQENINNQEAIKFMNKINNEKLDVDPNILTNSGEWITKDNVILNYKSQWLSYLLPRLAGAEDIFETNSNPKYNFMFMGLKFISIDMNINRFLSRANANTYVDLIMLEEYNGLKLKDKLCIPNMTIRQGKLKVFDKAEIEKMMDTIKYRLNLYYKKNMSIEEIKKRVKKCMAQGFEIYKGAIVKDPDTNIIKGFHLSIKEEIFEKYSKNIEYLLDVGTGKLTDLRFWNRVGIKNVYGIEPSSDSVEKAFDTLEKTKNTNKTKVNIIHSVGDVEWTKDEKFKELIKHKYDMITFQYTFHYMLDNIDLMIKNMKSVMKKGTKIIITCMDGNKINQDFSKYGKVEVRNNQEPIFAIVPLYEYKKIKEFNGNDILVYFKGAYGVANGSIEKIININMLIDKFKENKINLLERKSFTQYETPIKHKMRYNQKQVSSYYTSLIFENNN